MKLTIEVRFDGKFDLKNHGTVLHTYETEPEAKAAESWLLGLDSEFEDEIGCGNK